ncbi:MogA/MoaB family molybdenum cofactor biosynthesis protein [Salinarchaeum laminariae]|uniref:MogA/MoaB family molybdenum cofactor biosynthesis protein n=1 Tax=Salinarchaeum laminariae TaxID=869888 RepID=UPI00217540B6|nr:molybdenum cofactor synthesis domain-containing protein [Salinarchaeum laminariae]
MVDFQSRDTRRSRDSSDDEPDASAGGDGNDGEVNGGDPNNGSEEANGSDASGGDHESDTSDEGHECDASDENDASHDHHAEDLETVSAAILTVSSTRTIEEDASGNAIVEVLEREGHEIATRELVNDDYDGVQSAVDSLVNRGDVDAVVTTGGTGVSPDDVTPEAVRPLFEKQLPGFGETFRALSREEIGTRAIATRALAGIADGVPVFCLPGSEAGARLGTEAVIEPEVGHLAGLSRPHETEE